MSLKNQGVEALGLTPTIRASKNKYDFFMDIQFSGFRRVTLQAGCRHINRLQEYLPLAVL